MDIEEFYDADTRRRSSAEIEFGRDWHDAMGVRYELSWVADTGELYVMVEPVPASWVTPFGGIRPLHVHTTDNPEIRNMAVAVVAHVATQEELEALLTGWEQAMGTDDSIRWLVDQLRRAGALAPPVDGSPTPS